MQCVALNLHINLCHFQRAMEDIGLKPEEICDIFKIVASVLKLGNLQFVPTTNMDGTEGCSIANEYGKLSQNLCTLIAFIRIVMEQSLLQNCTTSATCSRPTCPASEVPLCRGARTASPPPRTPRA